MPMGLGKGKIRMKKVLIGFFMDGRAGGIDKYLLNFLEVVSGEDVRMDFLTNEIDEELKEKLRGYHSRLFAVANLKHPLKQYTQVRQILRKGKYDAVYLNISTAIDCIAAIAARHEKVPKRMIHSHSSGNDCESTVKRFAFDVIHSVCRLFLWTNGTHFYGCSEKAGEWLFPKRIVRSDRFHVIYNAVDRSVFQYDEAVRKEVRKELGVDDKFVIGHVGNFCYQKNHEFIIDVFEEVLKRNPKAELLLVGKGVRFEDIQEKVKRKGMEGSVQFLGWIKDVDKVFQAMDLFLLPSNFEGLGIVGIEAQCCGLPCVMSSRIPREVKITKRCYFLSLKSGAEKWAEFITRGQWKRGSACCLAIADEYDLENQKEQLKNLL